MSAEDTIVHLVAGGLGGTVGAVITCPLEVVKTRLQSSSVSAFSRSSSIVVPKLAYAPVGQLQLSMYSSQADSLGRMVTLATQTPTSTAATATQGKVARRTTYGLYHCLRHIVTTEGPRALLKGLGPNLVGVAPSRAIYFYTYAQSKQLFNTIFTPDTSIVHLCSAALAGFSASTATNPIWFVKTRLQLDNHRGVSTVKCIRQVYRTSGILGFYKGVSASYYGISETIIHFVIYEAIKARLLQLNSQGDGEDADKRMAVDFLKFMVAGATSKTIATCLAYPHEVARTRLREEGSRYRSFWQTLLLVAEEEGIRGLYRGLFTQLVRQIPNTAIMMSTYEAVVYLSQQYIL
jgi:solute carrier family 25, member 33/36